MIPFINFDEDFLTTEDLLFLAGASGGNLNEYTATGNPLTFTTNIAKPLKSLLIPWTPTQAGSGDPSPENVRSISGITGLTVSHSGADTSNPTTYPVTFPALGKNLLDPSACTDGCIWWKGELKTGYATNSATEKIPVKPGQTYRLARNSGSQNYISWFDSNGDYISQEAWAQSTPTKTIPDGAYFIGISLALSEKNNAMLSEGSTEYPFEPYTNTVYGGTLDVITGVLTVSTICYNGKWGDGRYATVLGSNERKTFDIYDGSLKLENQQTNKLCNIAKWSWNYNSDTPHYYVSTVNSKGIGYLFLPVETDSDTVVQICADLATEQTIQLTPQQITALLGDNTVWTDTNGTNTAVYLKRG